MEIDEFKYDSETDSDGVVADGQDKNNPPEAVNNSSGNEVIQQANDVILSEEIINFLADLRLNNNRQVISQILESDDQLRDGLKAYILENNSSESKANINSLQFKLMRCKTGDEIKSVIAENIPGGYKVGDEKMIERMYAGEKMDGISLENIKTADQKLEQVQADAEQVQADAEQVQADAEQLKNNAETAENRIQMVEEAENRWLNYRTQLLVGHDDVKEKTEETAKLAQQQVPQETRDQLKGKGYNDDVINNYILLRVTLNEVRGNSKFDKNQVEQFEKGVNELSTLDVIFKSLDNACNISDATFDSFSESNIKRTMMELFHKDKNIGNESLKSFKEARLKSSERRAGILDTDDKLIEQYGKFLSNNDKWLLEVYDRQREQHSLDGYKDSDEYKALFGILNGIKEKMQNMVEELCMTSQIKGFLDCIPKEYVNQFQFNKANEISIDQDGVLQLNGHVNGIDFSLKQDTNDEDARLQTSTMLFKDGNDIDLSGKYKNSPFILPTSDQVFKMALESLKSDSLSKIQNQNDYFETLEDMMLKNIGKLYSKTEYSHNYVKHQIISEEIVSKTKGILVNLGGAMPETLNGSNGKLYEFFDTICLNLGNMSSREKESFLKCIEKLGEIINREGNDSERPDSLAEDGNLSRILGSKKQAIKEIKRESLTNEEKENKSLLDLFKPCFNGDLQKNLGLLLDFLADPKNKWENLGKEVYPDIYGDSLESDYDLAFSEAYSNNDIKNTDGVITE